MPLDHPSQAQTAGLKFVEGLLGGMKSSQDADARNAYLQALYAGKQKTDPIALEQEKQKGREALMKMKPAPAPRGGGKPGFNALKIGGAEVQSAVAEARRKAEDADPLHGDLYQTTYNNELRPRLQSLADTVNTANRARKGSTLLPEEMQTAEMAAALVGELMPAEKKGWPLGIGDKPAVLGPMPWDQAGTGAPPPSNNKKKTLQDY